MENKEKIIREGSIIILLVIILAFILFMGLIIQTGLRVRDNIIYDEAKKEFIEFSAYQVELLQFCVNEGDLDFDTVIDDFIRFKAEEIIEDNN